MNLLLEGDYIEHWEDGIGKIIASDDSTVTVDFRGKGQVRVPRDKTAHFRKLNPAGLLAQFYENPGHIQTLIDRQSTEIIRLLILDEGSNKGNKIERTRIKALLTSAGSKVKGWRSNFNLVSESKWKTWWAAVSKKLTKDPSLDTSSKSIIALREKPASLFQSLHEKFIGEKDISKKLAVCDQLIKNWEKIEDQNVRSTIAEYVADLITNDQEGIVLDSAIYSAVLLLEKGVSEDILEGDAYRILFESLLRNALPSQKLVKIYSYLSSLQSQDIFDHLILFLLGDEKLREIIYKKVSGKKWAEKARKTKDCLEHLTPEQVKAFEVVNGMKRDHFCKALDDISKFFRIGVYDDQMMTTEKSCVSKFITALLLSPAVELSLKEATAKIVADLKIKSVAYGYLNKIDFSEGDQVSYLPLLLDVIGPGDAEKVLINEMTAQERPNVFLQALKVLLGSKLIKDHEKHLLLARVSEILSKMKSNNLSYLRLQVEKLSSDGRNQQESVETIDASELVRIAKTKLIPLGRRLDAVDILTDRGLKADLQAVANTIALGISKDDFVLLGHIFDALKEGALAKDLFKIILDNLHLSGGEHRDDFVIFLKNTRLGRSLAEFILVDLDDNWHTERRTTILNLMADEQLAKEIIRFGIENIVFSAHSSVQMQKNFYSYCSKFVDLCMGEVKSLYEEKVALSEEITKKAHRDYEEQLNAIADNCESQVIEAIDKTSQRYEEYLKRFIPIVDELETIIRLIDEAAAEKGISSPKEIINKLSVIKENIQGGLRIAGVMKID